MNKLLGRLLQLSGLQLFILLMLISVVISYFVYQNVLAPQFVKIDRQDNQLKMLKSRLENYFDNEEQITNNNKMFAQQEQQLNDFEQKLKQFNPKAPEQTLLIAARETNVKLQQIQISTLMHDQLGRYYQIEIAIKNDLIKISQFLTHLINQSEFAIWHQLIITKLTDEFSLKLVAKYYLELFDGIPS